MNEKTRCQIEEMKKQTIGVEVEMNSISRDKAARLAAEFFGTGRYENTAHRNGYSTWSAWDADGREWKFQKDVSISGPDSEKCELVTPILTYGDIETLQELCRQLRHAGAKSDASRGCGVHIHIGAKGHTPQTLRNLANIMASHESLLAEALNLDHYRMSRYQYFTKFNVEGLLRGDYASRMSGYATARQNGWMSANDIRELENMDRIPAEEGGDLYLINGNMLPLGNAGAFADTQTGKEENPDEEVLEVEEPGGDGGSSGGTDAVPQRHHRRGKLV